MTPPESGIAASVTAPPARAAPTTAPKRNQRPRLSVNLRIRVRFIALPFCCGDELGRRRGVWVRPHLLSVDARRCGSTLNFWCPQVNKEVAGCGASLDAGGGSRRNRQWRGSVGSDPDGELANADKTGSAGRHEGSAGVVADQRQRSPARLGDARSAEVGGLEIAAGVEDIAQPIASALRFATAPATIRSPSYRAKTAIASSASSAGRKNGGA